MVVVMGKNLVAAEISSVLASMIEVLYQFTTWSPSCATNAYRLDVLYKLRKLCTVSYSTVVTNGTQRHQRLMASELAETLPFNSSHIQWGSNRPPCSLTSAAGQTIREAGSITSPQQRPTNNLQHLSSAA